MAFRKKKDEHNYHKNQQDSFAEWMEKVVDAMPPVKPRAGTTTSRPSKPLNYQQIKADAEAQIKQQYLLRGHQYYNASFTRVSTPYSPTTPNTPPSKTMQPKYEIDQLVRLKKGTVPYKVLSIDVSPQYRYPVYVIEAVKTGRKEELYERDIVAYEPPKPKVKVSFDSVIMPDEKRQQILEALEQVHQSELIFETWGFGETVEKGRGVSMLFYGPPGTGKTLVAQAIAHKLDYKLKVISTADIQSSAPGEAERNIRKHFKEAKGGKTILLFDECDSMIYTRTHVGPIMGAQINELLSQIERFDGITVFTTNRLGTLDEAVNRRLALKLEFAMPSPSERAEIWQRMFPKKAPLSSDIDWLKLASIEMTGGYIKNAVLRAARMAAIEKVPDEDKQITMAHLVKALKLEAESMIEFEDARDKHKRGVGRLMPQNTNEIVRG